MIYFLQPVDGGPVKIGTTVNLDLRRKQLEAHYGQPLAVLATLEGGRKEEAEIHARFAHLRMGSKEQFRPTAELMEFIGRPLLVDANPDAVEAMPSRTKPIRLEITEDQLAKLRVLAAKAGMSMAAYARAVVVQVIEANEGAPER